MANSIALNPLITTNAAGLFSSATSGLVSGTAYDSPNTRYSLAGGIVDLAVTQPMWGGIGIYENVPLSTAGKTTPSADFGGYVGPATNITAFTAKSLVAFSVFDQAHNGIITPQSKAPLYPAGSTISLYRLGSKARLILPIDPTLAATLQAANTPVNSQVSWDYINQGIVPYAPAYAAVTITGAVWASTAGGQTTLTVSTNLTAVLAANSVIDVSGVISTGGTGAGFNGNFLVVSVSATTVVVTQAAASSPGTYSSAGTIAAGGGALPVNILFTQTTSCKVPVYNTTTGFLNWNNTTGACAVVEI